MRDDEVRTFFKQPRPKATRQAQARARRDRGYTAWRARQLELRPWCEVRRHGVCTDRAREIHHRRLVKQGGKKMLEANTLAVCGECHSWIHRNISQAKAAGWLVGRGDREWGELGDKRSGPNVLLVICCVIAAAALITVTGVCGLLVVLLVFALAAGAF